MSDPRQNERPRDTMSTRPARHPARRGISCPTTLTGNDAYTLTPNVAQHGTTPGRYVEQVRLEAARRQLESTDHSIGEVARASGFTSYETMRRVFQQQRDVSPADCRRTFGDHGRRHRAG